STWSADFGESHAPSITTCDLGQMLIVNAAALAAFGVLWVGKFMVLHRVLFAHAAHPAPPEPEPVACADPASPDPAAGGRPAGPGPAPGRPPLVGSRHHDGADPGTERSG